MDSIIIREYKQGRISISGGMWLLKAVYRWAASYEAEYRDKDAIMVCKAVDTYRQGVKEKEAKRIWKDTKSHKRSRPLTQEERKMVKGTQYEWMLKELGWLK